MLKVVCQNTQPFHSHRKITTRFDGGSLTSDAGWLLFGSLDRQHRLCEGFSSCISESRDQRYVRHDLLKLIRQRVLQIVAGYGSCIIRASRSSGCVGVPTVTEQNRTLRAALGTA